MTKNLTSSPKTKCPVRTIGNKIVVLRDEKEDLSAGGIILPDNSKEIPYRGRIIAVGPGLRRMAPPWDFVPMNTKIGDYIYFPKFGITVTTLEIDKQEYIVIKEDDVIAIEKE